ncbi:uncharacterized protein LOC115796392 [Archocentrus centrarchus]|uniref:uncharacterized protein LOC115796392 n=1 Tax=Archocentrus centrarchus TaxID=63155 RepID=UPI0011EA1B33|nr:uncharacterized protein LOC115796392 [Archocentrus centrarchus]
MSDCWTYSSSSTPPITYHSALSQTPPSLSSPHSSFRNHGNPHAKVTSPHLFPQHQVSSFPFFHQPQISSPQTPSPHLTPTQLTSPHFPYPPVTSPHLIPHAQVTSPHRELQSPITSPHLLSPAQHALHPEPQPQIISPHLLSSPQHPLFSQNPDPDLDHSDWIKCEPSSELSCLLNGNGFPYQNQTSTHLDFHNQFNSGLAHHGESLEDTHRSYDADTLLFSGICAQSDTSNAGEDTWRHLEPTVSQLQCSALDSVSAGAQQAAPSPHGLSVERWRSPELNSAEDFSGTQFFPDSFLNASQPFCSPTTPGPSPHYPQTPTVSSPSPQMHPRTERTGFHTQMHRDQIPDPGQYHQHQTNQQLLSSQTEQIQDLTGLLHTAGTSKTSFSPSGRGQHVGRAAQCMSLSAGLNWTEECGEKKGKGRGGDDGQPDWNWMQLESLDSRLMCVVCKRDFRSLPALNGHMRSHSGFRLATCSKKDSSPPVQRSNTMVMPVSIPVKSRRVSKTCRSSQTRGSHLPLATGSTALYRSLMHPQEGEDVTKGIKAGENRAVSAANKGGGHYTPPPMLCPQRAGSGLYCSLTTRRQQRVQTVQLHNGISDLGAAETAVPPPGTLTSGTIKPQINLGQGFQAEIPPLQDRKCAHFDSHSAVLQWTPWDDLERPVNQQRVEALLMMAQSSVVPRGGANAEYSLQVLSECKGDFLLTVEKLLSTPESSKHTGVSWSAAEKRLLVKSLQLHQKDFKSIQKVVQTKSLSQCVEFYYLWKKKMSLNTKTQTSLTVTLPSTNGQRSSRSQAAS